MTINEFMRGPLLACIYIVGVFGIVASGGGGGGGSNGIVVDPVDAGTTYNYTVTSATFFSGGQQVAVIRFGLSGSCSNPTGVTSAITRVGAGTVSTPGTVSFSFTTTITPPMFESVYIDNNASGNLDNGDRVWGDDPNDLIGVCFDAFNTDQTFDWEDVADQIQAALGLLQPSIIYTGAPQTFRSEPGSKPELMIDNTIIADGDGYDSIITVTIDIKPASTLNSIDPGSKEVITAAILGSIDYDATQSDFSTVRFGLAEATPTHDGHVADVNGDGFYDMVFHFKTEETGIFCGDTKVTLMGKTFDGSQFVGTDTVRTIGCN